MFTILDGRSQFYQWDLDRQLVVNDPTIKEVHFCNRTGDCSLVVEVKDGLADVPNVLLTKNWRINVYAYDDKYTKHCEVFEVAPRSKPADYVYTETEVLSYHQLEERLDKIEAGDMSKVIEEYLKDNPLDAPVMSVNGKLGEVVLSAEDVGALPNTTEIPSIEGLATEDYVDKAVNNIPKVDLTDYATKKYVEDAVEGIVIPDLNGYATEAYVDKKVSEAQIGGGDVDLSNYYTKSQTDAAINAAKPDLSKYALKTEIPSTAGLATETYVNNSLSNYYTKSQVEGLIPDVSGYQTAAQVQTAINSALSAIGVAEEGRY